MNEREKTIDRLYRQYSGVLYDLCYRVLGDRTEAQDALQETFINAFKSLETFRYGDSHLPWLYRVATNSCYRLLRKRTKRARVVVAQKHSGDETTFRVDPADVIHSRETLEKIFGDLDERGVQIFIAHYFGGMDQGQIAESLGVSRRAVVKRFTAMRKKAAAYFEDNEDKADE